MAKYLSDDERRQVADVDTFVWKLDHPIGTVCWIEANAVVGGHAGDYLPGGYSDPELTRLAKAFSECFGYFSKRLNNQDAVIAMIIECLEETRLPLIEALNILEGLPKSKKVIPSIAEFNEMFSERKELLKRALLESWNLINEHMMESTKTLECLTEAVDGFRKFLPDFPTPEDISDSWQAVFDAPLGVYMHDDLDINRERMTVFREGMQAGEFWPAVNIYCLHFAAQIPSAKLPSAIDYVEGVCGDTHKFFCSTDLPMHWRTAVANASSLSAEAQAFLESWDDPDPAAVIHYTLDATYRDEINANWLAKLDATTKGEADG